MEKTNSFSGVKYKDNFLVFYRNMNKSDALSLCSYIEMSTDEIKSFMDSSIETRKLYCDRNEADNTISYVIKLDPKSFSINKFLKGTVYFDRDKLVVKNSVYFQVSDTIPYETTYSMFELNLSKVKEDVDYDYDVNSMTKIEKRKYYKEDIDGSKYPVMDRERELIYLPDKKYFYDVTLNQTIPSELDYGNSSFMFGNLNVEYNNFNSWSEAVSILEFLNMSISPTNGMLTDKLTMGNIYLKKKITGEIEFKGTFNDDIYCKREKSRFVEGHITYMTDKNRMRQGFGQNILFVTSNERNDFLSDKKENFSGFIEQFSTQRTSPKDISLIHKYDVKRNIVRVVSDVKKYEIKNSSLPNDIKKVFPSDFNTSENKLSSPIEIRKVKQLTLQKR